MKRHVLKPPVPIRALLIAATGTVLGALIVVLATALSWPGVLIGLGVLVGVLGLAVLLFALITPHRLQVEVTTDEAGYRITSNHQRADGRWDEVVRALQSDTGARITLERRDGTEHHILAPGTATRSVMDDLAADVQGRLKVR